MRVFTTCDGVDWKLRIRKRRSFQSYRPFQRQSVYFWKEVKLKQRKMKICPLDFGSFGLTWFENGIFTNLLNSLLCCVGVTKCLPDRNHARAHLLKRPLYGSKNGSGESVSEAWVGSVVNELIFKILVQILLWERYSNNRNESKYLMSTWTNV